ncbi:MAG: MotA/TolQ/ExbB proton channel family protein [Planctomycetota bacterium]|nr:MotA/TolQ/ExbB proton channel family protein [Planctomycetota bacterium]MDA1139007.1 MotA/TolQ/ExbB proton channel family protein [Planctomycetota bacterium]
MLEKIIQGGYMMIPLMICSVLALGVFIDRCLAFMRNNRIDVRALRAEILTLLAEGRDEDAITLCASTPGPVSAVLLVGLQTHVKLKAVHEKPDSIRTIMGKAMEDYSLHAMNAVQKRLSILATIGNAAPLFGMSGTVLGMISSFESLSSAAALDASLVAGGISEALITTAAGLLIALAAVIPLNIFTTMSENIELEIEDAASELVETVTMSAIHAAA